MKKNGKILHKDLVALIGRAAHGDMIIVSDAGLAVPSHIERVELAIEKDYPDIPKILRLLQDELIVEKVLITDECRENNRPHFDAVSDIYRDDIAVLETIPHEKLLSEILPMVKAVVRTGAFCPYGNVVLFPGIDAPEWFSKEGLDVPDFYKKRVPKKYGGEA